MKRKPIKTPPVWLQRCLMFAAVYRGAKSDQLVRALFQSPDVDEEWLIKLMKRTYWVVDKDGKILFEGTEAKARDYRILRGSFQNRIVRSYTYLNRVLKHIEKVPYLNNSFSTSPVQQE